MAKIADYTIKGKSGTSYTFELYWLESTNWAANPGVYVITKRTAKQDGGGEHFHIYCGETDDLKTRHGNHHKRVCFMNNGGNCLGFLYEANADRRLAIETDIRNNGDKWPCNGQ